MYLKTKLLLALFCIVAITPHLTAQSSATSSNRYKLEVTYIANGQSGSATIDLLESRRSMIYLSGQASDKEGSIEIVAFYSYSHRKIDNNTGVI